MPLERERRANRLRRQAGDAYRRASVITSVCSANVRDQRRLGARRADSLVIPNCVAPVPARTAEHRSPGRLHVGFVGRVVPIKDVATLIRAAALAARSIEIRLSLVGPLDHDPAYVSRCRALARKLGLAVEFVGETDPRSCYPQFDVVALSSLSEAQPLALLEAMVAGVPVLATSVGGCRELIEGPLQGARVGPAGLLVPARDPAATAQALLHLASDPALRTRLGANGCERTSRRHTPAGVWGAYQRMYQRVAA